MIPIIDNSNGHPSPILKQEIHVKGYVPKRKDRQKLIINYLKAEIQPGIEWSRQQAKRLAEKSQQKEKTLSYAIKGLNLFDSGFAFYGLKKHSI